MEKIRDINTGDFFTFKAADNKYKVIFCTSLCKDKSPYHFTFAALNYDQVEKPTIQNILES